MLDKKGSLIMDVDGFNDTICMKRQKLSAKNVSAKQIEVNYGRSST